MQKEQLYTVINIPVTIFLYLRVRTMSTDQEVFYGLSHSKRSCIKSFFNITNVVMSICLSSTSALPMSSSTPFQCIFCANVDLYYIKTSDIIDDDIKLFFVWLPVIRFFVSHIS